ncbi:MAG: helix-turn-helix transcriptional regulator [Alphaproteobacteria bacterium]|nr:helix-turn-helix transcriptional regulator [Alphaproteobacteria bacterium]
MNNAISLHSRLKEAREFRGWTLQHTANMMGVTQDTLRGWESGKTVPRVNRLLMVAGVLGVPLKWLLTGAEDLDPGLDSRTRLDIIAAKLDEAVKMTSALQTRLNEVSAEVAIARRINAHLDQLAEV